MKSKPTKLYEILRIEEESLKKLDSFMSEAVNKDDVVSSLENDIYSSTQSRLEAIGLSVEASSKEVVDGLSAKIGKNEDELYAYMGITRDNFDFNKVRDVAYKINTEKEGFFLKKENAEEILKKHPPEGVLKYLGYSSVKEMLSKEDVVEIFSALRFVESDEWMHKTFDIAYGEFNAGDFEKRPIELRVLSNQWMEIAEKFVAKKHHNVSHLKEFGVIFLNPINQTAPGALLRDFALFFHYFHEISFYSKLFEDHSKHKDFGERLKSSLRGDVPEKSIVEPGEWLIIQRYLWKENLDDPRLFLPRVNPESLHWHKAEKDLVKLGMESDELSLDFWQNLDYVAGYFKNDNGKKDLVSFDMEDNAMTFAANHRGARKEIWYHQQEALWNEFFCRYLGMEQMEKLILENFYNGTIAVKK